MNRPKRLRGWLLAPLIYIAAVLLLIEEWCWDVGSALVARIAAWPPWRAMEDRVRGLSPYAALCFFVLPAVLLFPVKLLALLAIANGYPFSGVLVILIAKIGGAAAVARLYALTKPALLSLAWFARWHSKFMELKERWVGRLKGTLIYQGVALRAAKLKAMLRGAWHDLRPSAPMGSRHGTYTARILRRFVAMWRARRR